MEPPESSRVVEDNSDFHHKYHHHFPITANVKGATLIMRNIESNIKMPHAT